MKKIIVVAFLGLLVYSCQNELEQFPSSVPLSKPLTITGNLDTIKKVSQLYDMIKHAELEETLKSSEYTLLAPKNKGIKNLFNYLGIDSIQQLPPALAKTLVFNFLIKGKHTVTDLKNKKAGYLKTHGTDSNGNYIDAYFSTDNAIVFNGTAKIEDEDIESSNGIIHIVDSAFTPPTVATFIELDANLSEFKKALSRKDLGVDYLKGFSESGLFSPFTVYAPVNSAFDNETVKVLEGLSVDNFAAKVLNMHFKAKDLLKADDIKAKDAIEVQSGETITVIKNGESISLKPLKGKESKIITTNIHAGNGVIHLIDTVLLGDTSK